MSRSAQLALAENGTMRERLEYIEGRHELLHLYFVLVDLIKDSFCDASNLEEASSLARMIQDLNPKLMNKKGKEEFYAFRAVFKDIFIALVSQFLCSFLGVDDLNFNCTPDSIKKIKIDSEKQAAFVQLFRSFIRNSHCDFENCSENLKEANPLPPYYPHHEYLRNKTQQRQESSNADVTKDPVENVRILGTKKTKQKEKVDLKNSYSKSLMSILGTFFLLIEAAKQGNGLVTFIIQIQKKLLKPIQQTGHKNYAVSLLSYKHTVLGHRNAQFAHQFMWNCSAGRKGRGNKFPRDQKVEHINRFLKDSFRSLGPNLTPVTSKRVNNSSDFGIKLEDKLVDFFELSKTGKSHALKDHSVPINKIFTVLKKEQVAAVVPGRKFKGPKINSNFFNSFDEVKYRCWHVKKDSELYRGSARYRNSHLY